MNVALTTALVEDVGWGVDFTSFELPCGIHIVCRGTVNQISIGRNDLPFGIQDRVIEVKPIEIECHRANSEGGKPDSDSRQSTHEKTGLPLPGYGRTLLHSLGIG